MEGIRYITVEETHAVLAVALLGSKSFSPRTRDKASPVSSLALSLSSLCVV
jgi:hypothetical protein